MATNVARFPMDRTGWVNVGTINAIPRRGSRIVRTPQGDVALFRTEDDRIFAIDDHCPHRRGPLSQGIVAGDTVICPLHNWVISLESGEAQGADKGCIKTHAVQVLDGLVFLSFARIARRAG
jgi:nitrite reductase (NADH) small subunit